MRTIIIDNFLTTDECNFIIKLYKDNENHAEKFNDVFPLQQNIFEKKASFLKNKLNKVALEYNSKIDWFQIVKWPINSKMDAHLDMAEDRTTLSSIIYLNSNYNGGQTYFEEGTIFKPRIGRAIFFNGQYYKHGVTLVNNTTRYVVAAWYKKLDPFL